MSALIDAGVHRAASIKVAEAAKVIENTQRDLNIALMNELAPVFDRLGIDTLDVLEAAGMVFANSSKAIRQFGVGLRTA